ncbi:hypothetical protein [Vibrio amylolyticus]|uniref:hypothetical protein n=1 Tax=Vibrio amylolyticus TaxID=2847292 RepID=UPI003D0472AD
MPVFNQTSRLESKSSSEIENIVTTTGTLFKHKFDSSSAVFGSSISTNKSTSVDHKNELKESTNE